MGSYGVKLVKIRHLTLVKGLTPKSTSELSKNSLIWSRKKQLDGIHVKKNKKRDPSYCKNVSTENLPRKKKT